MQAVLVRCERTTARNRLPRLVGYSSSVSSKYKYFVSSILFLCSLQNSEQKMQNKRVKRYRHRHWPQLTFIIKKTLGSRARTTSLATINQKPVLTSVRYRTNIVKLRLYVLRATRYVHRKLSRRMSISWGIYWGCLLRDVRWNFWGYGRRRRQRTVPQVV